MSAGAAGGGLHWSMLEGCISGRDLSIQRRPYHKNCKCALHRERGQCTHSPPHNTVSYPIRRKFCNSAVSAAAYASAAAAVQGGITRAHTRLVLTKEEDEDGD